MANIRKLPDGSAVLKAQSGSRTHTMGSYGPHLHVVAENGTATLFDQSKARLAKVAESGAFHCELTSLDSLTVPYVNRFLSSTGMVVIMDWRTKTYRLKARKVAKTTSWKVPPRAATLLAPAAPPKVVVATPTPAFVPPTVAPTEQPAAVITVSSEAAPAHHHVIPGMEYLTKVKAKGAGRGFTNLDSIIIPTADFETLNDAWELRSQGLPAAVLITGPAGTAKTVLVRAFAATLGVPFLKVDGGAVRTADDWAGAFRQDRNTKTWSHRWSPFAEALRAGQPCVILIDELTRTESPQALNALLGLLDTTGSLLVPDANSTLKMPKGILVVATANIGPEFVGTLPLDGAVRQRFPYGVRMDYPPEATEAKLLVDMTGVTADIAERLVRMAVQQRIHRDDAQQYPSGSVISTRVLLNIANRIVLRNTDPRNAVVATLRGQFDPGDEAAISIVVDSQFPKTSPKVSPTEQPAATITVGKHSFNGTGPTCERYNYVDNSYCLMPKAHPVHSS